MIPIRGPVAAFGIKGLVAERAVEESVEFSATISMIHSKQATPCNDVRFRLSRYFSCSLASFFRLAEDGVKGDGRWSETVACAPSDAAVAGRKTRNLRMRLRSASMI